MSVYDKKRTFTETRYNYKDVAGLSENGKVMQEVTVLQWRRLFTRKLLFWTFRINNCT